VSRAEFKDTFAKWFAEWDAEKKQFAHKEKLRTGLSAALPSARFADRAGPGVAALASGNMPRVEGGQTRPLVPPNDPNNRISKLLAVPSLRAAISATSGHR